MYDAILRGDINLAVTTDILDEYVEVLDAFFGSDALGNLIAKTILELPGTQKIIVRIHWKLIADDPDDDKFVDCAVAANADLIVTNDRHFKVLKKVGFLTAPKRSRIRALCALRSSVRGKSTYTSKISPSRSETTVRRAARAQQVCTVSALVS